MDYIVPPRWKPPEEIPNTRHKKGKYWHAKFRCCCGNIYDPIITNAERNEITSCGCGMFFISKTFYDYKDNYEADLGLKLISIKLIRSDKGQCKRNAFGIFECHCCGENFIAKIAGIKNGKQRSCGCLKKFAHSGYFENSPYYGEVDMNPSKEKIKKAVAEMKRTARHEIYITDEEMENLITDNCYWLNTKPSRLFFTKILKEAPFYIHGIDRLDSNGHYTKENSVTCSAEANFFKNSIPSEKFLEMCNQVVKTHERRIRNNEAHRTGSGITLTSC